MKRFSIIIPAYNAETTIKRSLDSVYVLPVSEDEYEVIVIDDCSNDQTVDIVKAYAQFHPNLTLIIQPQNHRQGAARNRGIKVAQGDCVVFLDSDDEIALGILPAWDLLQKTDSDMVVMRFDKFSNEGDLKSEVSLPYTSDMVFTGVALQTEHPFFCTAPWAYIYRRAFLEKVNYHFAEGVLYEDSDFVNVHLFNAIRIAYSDMCGYHVWSNPLSTTHTISFKHVCDYALLGTRMLSLFQQIDDKNSTYAKSILEGGSYNIMRSCKNLLKLHSVSDIRSFYTRFDRLADRSTLLSYSEPAYCWNSWTRFCVKHKYWTIIIVGSCLPFLSFVSFVKRVKR
jgi:glycosyltransferase involved in cell wall biosynthesis